jgi:single-stranded-DNA-specific exonuclease
MPKIPLKWKSPKKVRGEGFEIKGYPDWFLDILVNRSIDTNDKIDDFLNPNYEKIVSPKKFLNIDAAVERIVKAKETKEKVVIYGDYDVDGITATAVAYEMLNKIGVQNVETYIPHREEEGYGLNADALASIRKSGVTLVIAVDCGITSRDLINAEKKLDFIVVDHHTIATDKLPKRGILLHPSLTKKGEEFGLSAAGMAFILALALQQRLPKEFGLGQEKWLLDLVALSTICDIMPLTDTNRLLAHFGLLVLNKTKREGLRALLNISGVELGKADAYSAGFLLGPRLNAAGRLESAQKALDLLLTKDAQEARKLAVDLNRLNTERQLLCERIVEEARQAVESGDGHETINLLSNKNWPRGVAGIVASRITDYYNRPAIIFEDDGENHHGSARSIEGVNIIELLTEVSDYVVKFGGHAKAAGLTVSHEHFVLFKEKLISLTGEKLKQVELSQELMIEAEIKPEEINDQAMELLSKMEPTGFGNKRPVLMIAGAKVGEIKRVGKGKEHLKFNILPLTPHLSPQTSSLPAVAFSEEREVVEGKKHDFALTLKYNEWNNRRTIEARIIDFQLSA